MDIDYEAVDEWFYDSIKRYKQLQMFEFQNVAKQFEFSDAKSICVASTDETGHDEILELSLPKKLVVKEEQEGLTKNTDLKMKNAGFVKAPLVQMEVLYGQQKVITSEKGQNGVSIYNLGSEETDVISRISVVPCELWEPRLTLNKTNLLGMTTTNNESLSLMDVQENRIVDTIRWNTESQKQIIEPEFVSSSVIALCNVDTGSVDLFDIRMKQTSYTILSEIQGGDKQEWTISSSYHGYSTRSDDGCDITTLGLLSTVGTVCIYDLRNMKAPLFRRTVDGYFQWKETVITQSVLNIQFCPANTSIISISGFDNNIYIFDTSSNTLKTIFIHDGHSKLYASDKNNRTTYHIWYQENTIISASENKSLHCWKYVPLEDM